jgi:hypothetical protein
MTIYFDENIPKHLAEGFALIQKFEGLKANMNVEVKYIPTAFNKGIKDPDWLRQIEKNKSYVITQDVHLNRRKQEIELYRKQGIGLFLLRGKSKKQGMSVWEMVEALAKQWPEILEIIRSKKPPFAYEVKLKGQPKMVA